MLFADNMELIIAKNSGLCYGVKRALQLAKSTRLRKTGPVQTLGELIHNPRVIADLKKEGLSAAAGPESVERGTIIIRSHGVGPDTYQILKKKKIEVVDATCPIVMRIQKLVERLVKKGEDIIIVGNREHPEIRGLLGYSRGRGRIIENEAQARRLPRRKKRAVLAQSTQDLLLYSRVVGALLERTKELDVYNTICHFTQTRQKSTADLAARVDTLFIVGGKRSSNTTKLYHLAKRILPNTHFIESAAEIHPRLLEGAKRIGISGGASTPPEAIAEAVAKIRNSFKRQAQREDVGPWQS
ncbi:MAG: 4-hydroxy-3-methylbut-2-enyl diphosphate reductase [Acidobacteriota bacterium]